MPTSRRLIKQIGKWITAKINLNLPRTLQGAKFTVPLIHGIKVGVGSEPWMLDLLSVLLPRTTGLFMDVGVNLGQTLIKVRVVDPGRGYVGFEPNPSCVFYLHHLIEQNGWGELTAVIPCGLFSEDGMRTMVLFNQNLVDPAGSIIEGMRSDRPGSRTIHVPVFRYASLQNQVPQGRIAVVKSDVEGCELEVIDGLIEVIERDSPVLIFELLPVHSQENKLRLVRQETILALLEKLEYSVFRIQKSPSDHLAGLMPIRTVGLQPKPADQNYVAWAKNGLVRCDDLVVC